MRTRYPSLPRVARTLAFIAPLIALNAHAEETCGVLPYTFGDGFEAGALPPITLPPANAPLTLAIDPGQDGQIVNATRINLSGTFDGPPATGVAALDTPARLIGRRWLIADVPLKPGPNRINVIATMLAGATIERAVTITRDDALPAVTTWLATAAPGYSPINTRFALTLPTNVIAQRVRIDYDGDGRDDVDTRQVAAEYIARYEVPGFYTARITIDRGAGQTPSPIVLTTPVLVQHAGETRQTLCAVFAAMRTALAANDIPTALKALHPRLRDEFTGLWTAIGTQLPTVATQLGTLTDGTVSNEGFAEYQLERPNPLHAGEYMRYRVQFDQGRDGVWRVGGM